MPVFAQLFGVHINLDSLPALGKAKIQHVALDKSSGVMRIQIALSQLLTAAQLRQVSGALEKKLGLEKCEIEPHYPPELFSPDYFPELIYALRAAGVPVNGFLEDATAWLDDGVLRIGLKNGGLELLREKDLSGTIQRILLDRFSLSLQVELREEGAPGREQDDAQERELVRRAQEQLQNSAVRETAKAASGRRSRKDANEPDGAKKGRLSFDIAGLPFAGNEVQVLKGKVVQTPPTPLREIGEAGGGVVVWGDVFQIDCKISRDGSKKIYSVGFTDYTSSNVLKIFSDTAKPDFMDTLKKGDTLLVRVDQTGPACHTGTRTCFDDGLLTGATGTGEAS